MSLRAKTVFRITGGEEFAFDEIADGAKLSHGTFFMKYEGDLQGDGVLGELKSYCSDGDAIIFGFERFTGSLNGKYGSFVLEHIGKFENGKLISRRAVLPNSGTDELKGLRGEIDFSADKADEFALTLNYYYEES